MQELLGDGGKCRRAPAGWRQRVRSPGLIMNKWMQHFSGLHGEQEEDRQADKPRQTDPEVWSRALNRAPGDEAGWVLAGGAGDFKQHFPHRRWPSFSLSLLLSSILYLASLLSSYPYPTLILSSHPWLSREPNQRSVWFQVHFEFPSCGHVLRKQSKSQGALCPLMYLLFSFSPPFALSVLFHFLSCFFRSLSRENGKDPMSLWDL